MGKKVTVKMYSLFASTFHFIRPCAVRSGMQNADRSIFAFVRPATPRPGGT